MARILGFARFEPVLKLDNRWMAVIVFGLTLTSLSLLGVVLGNRYERDMQRGIERQLLAVARDAASEVDTEAQRALRIYGGVQSKGYRSEAAKLRQTLASNEEIRHVYTVYQDSIGNIHFLVDGTESGDADGDGVEDRAALGEPYLEAPKGLLEAFRLGQPVAVAEPYSDKWGTFVSAYAPFRNSKGELEGVLGVDLEYSDYQAAVESVPFFRQVWILCSLLFSGLCGVMTLFVLNRVHRRFLSVLDAKNTVEDSYRELERLNRQLDWQARTDALTGLLNRQGVIQVLTSSIAEMGDGPDQTCALALLDLDGFKLANDHFGHVFGDEYLVVFAARLAESIDGALLGRLGGDEFIVMVVSEFSLSNLQGQISDFQRGLATEPIMVGLTQQFPSVSVGIVQSGPAATPADLIRQADIAMYQAKVSGPGNLVVYEAWMGEALETRVALEREVRQGWESGEFWMAVQPIVDIRSGRTNAGEMLMRWTRSDGKFVSPADFIPVAENTGLIVDMGYWAIEEACRNLERLEREFPDERIHLSVNVSPRQLTQGDFVERLEEIVMQYSFHRGGLWLELTESSLINDLAGVRSMLNRIQAMGIMIALDDFGTGYSSLSMLLELPLDCIKIDRSFIQQLGEAEHSEELVSTIMQLSKMLELYVVAEGIESAEHIEILRQMGCEWGQGFFYSKPVTMTEFVDRVNGLHKAA